MSKEFVFDCCFFLFVCVCVATVQIEACYFFPLKNRRAAMSSHRAQ